MDRVDDLSDATARIRMDDAAGRCRSAPYPGKFDGRGIVTCGGGAKYLPSVWVCINMLRHHRCTMPIELWYLGDAEMPDELRGPIEALDVCCIDAWKVREEHPSRILNGWELKPYAIIHSRFREVLYLDADNVTLRNPTILFDCEPYQQAGAIFWPDFGRLDRTRLIWRFTGVPYADEPEFETGQIAVDKQRCWPALLLAMWMNEYSDFWYHHIHGDKETFHMAWRKLECPYAMPKRPIEPLAGTMCQHDFDGRRIFQHRNLKKWRLSGNERVYGFELEDQCLAYLKQMEKHERVLSGIPPFNSEMSEVIGDAIAEYHRIGYDRRNIVLLGDGRIGNGSDRMERFWGVRIESGTLVLEIFGDDGLTARMIRDPGNSKRWHGYWMIHERMPVEITLSSR